jgi:osmotically-inducible protein OsmY
MTGGSAAAAFADEPLWLPVSPEPVDSSMLDLELTLRARKALLVDDILARYTIGVNVHGRGAVLWGEVPSTDIAQRAEKTLGQVLGLTAVRDLLHVDSPSGARIHLPVLAALQPLSPDPQPSKPEPGRPAASLVYREAPNKPASTGDIAWRPVERKTSETSQHASQQWVAPQQAPGMQRQSAEQDVASMAQAVEHLRQADDRFSRIKLRLSNGVVHVSGLIRHYDDLFELARSISQVPGVQNVVVEDVRTD